MYPISTLHQYRLVFGHDFEPWSRACALPAIKIRTDKSIIGAIVPAEGQIRPAQLSAGGDRDNYVYQLPYGVYGKHKAQRHAQISCQTHSAILED